MSLRTKIYSWFRNKFTKEIDAELQLRITAFETLNKKSVEDVGIKYNKELEDFKQYTEERINREVMLKYTRLHWLVDPYAVFQVSQSGIPYINYEPITKNRAEILKTEAQQFKDTFLWEVLNNTLRQRAIEHSVLNSTNWEQVIAGKMMVHNLGLIKSIIDFMADMDMTKVPENISLQSRKVL